MLITAGLAAALVLIGALAYPRLKRWVKKCKRRRGGVYLWRVRHHYKPWRRVNGYVGETNSFYFRKRQQLEGVTRFSPDGKVAAYSWSDLDPIRYTLPLPWWLCWKWILRPLETVAMWITWPVYNDAKNHWNPRRIPKSAAKAMRLARDQGRNGVRIRAKIVIGRAGRLVQLAGLVMIAAGFIGWMVTQ